MKWRNNGIYDLKAVRAFVVGFALIAVLQIATRGVGFILVAPLIAVALLTNKTEKMFYWVVMLLSLMLSNSRLVPKGMTFFLGQRMLLVLFATVLMAKYVGQRKAPMVAPLLSMFLYLFYMIIPSALGWMPLISFLKLFLFSMIYMAYLGVTNCVAKSNKVDVTQIRGMFLGAACVYIFGSVMLFPFPGLTQVTGEEYLEALKSGREVVSLFTGMACHSQALGPIVAALSVLLYTDFAFCVKRPDKLYILLMVLAPIVIYRTSSRAGMLAYLAGHMFATLIIMQARGVNGRWRGKIMSTAMSLILVAFVGVLAIPNLRDSVTRFALKRTDAVASEFTTEAAMSSRQGLIDSALHNFSKSPLIGNGFQVSENMSGMRDVPFARLLSAPIEKGVWYAAVLEEGGAIGMGLLIVFILTAGFGMMRARAYMGLSVLFTVFVSNLGEFTMFSMSGLGGVIWGLVFIGVAVESVQKRTESQRRLAMPAWQGRPPPRPQFGNFH